MGKRNRRKRAIWRHTNPKPVAGVRFFCGTSLDGPSAECPILDDNRKIVIFLNESDARRFLELEFSAADQAHLDEMSAQLGCRIRPWVGVMGALKWALFQRENAGNYTEYATVEEAREAMTRKREKCMYLLNPSEQN